MIENKRVLALIPARGGSKGIKGKNIVDLGGKPLIAYTIDAAKKSRYVDDIVVSTDSEKIACVAREYGADIPFMRPSQFATDEAKTIDVVINAIKMLENKKRQYDILVLLQPTQPFRTGVHIDESLDLFIRKGCEGVVSVCEVKENPILMREISLQGKMKKFMQKNSTCRRQDMTVFYRVNGCIYINNINEVNDRLSFNDNMVPYIMSKYDSIDIDEESDLALARWRVINDMQRL